MTGFEVIVRPAVLPNIRPAPARVLAPEDDPALGIAVLSGSGGKLIDLTFSQQASMSRSKPKEKKRKFDVERVYHKDEETGEIDKSQYIDIERLKKVVFQGGDGVEEEYTYADPPEVDNVEILKRNQERVNE